MDIETFDEMMRCGAEMCKNARVISTRENNLII